MFKNQTFLFTINYYTKGLNLYIGFFIYSYSKINANFQLDQQIVSEINTIIVKYNVGYLLCNNV